MVLWNNIIESIGPLQPCCLMPFRFQAKYGLLTYAQCGQLDPFAVVEHLGRLGAECIVGRESHSNGGIHLHAFFMFESKFRSSDQRVFDVGGCHPNISRGYSNPSDGYDYAIKDGEVVGGGLARPEQPDVSKHSNWTRIVQAEDSDEFWALVRELEPRALCTNFTSLKAYSQDRYRPERSPYSTPDGLGFDTSQYPVLQQWVDSNIANKPDGR